MTLTKNQIKTAALKLKPADRETLAEELLLSIDDAERQAIDAAWLAEIRSREARFRTKKSSAKPVVSVIRRLQGKP